MTQKQKMCLNFLLGFRMILKDQTKTTIKGVEGLREANKILLKRRAAGILIGGLSESIWNKTRRPEHFLKHKDVDVLVLDDHFQISESLDGGIDWWLPHKENITLDNSVTIMNNIETNWYENCNGVILNFIMKGKLDFGLHIIDSSKIIEMREVEAKSNIDKSIMSEGIDQVVFDRFHKRLRNSIKTRVPEFISKEFQILSSSYGNDHKQVDIDGVDLDTIRGIKLYKKTISMT
jgi:hypothetical protein